MATSPISPADVHRRSERRLILLLLAPALAVVGGLLVVPLGWLAVQSVLQDGGFTLAHYARFFTDTVYWTTFLQTFRMAFVVTAATLVLGYPVAYVAASAPQRWSLVILAMVVLPFWTSVLVRAYAWLILLQRRGLVNSTLTQLGVIDAPLPLINNEFGTIVATVHILLPFMVLPLYAAMRKIPAELTIAGASLGGTPLHVFLRVFLPLSLPGIVAGMALVFVLTLGFYITPELLGGGRTFMVSMLISRNIEVAASSAVVATVLGVAAAYALNLSNARLVRSLQVVLMLPLVTPVVITAVGVFLVYANVGLLATMTGLILANVMLGLPYVVTAVLAGLRKFDPAQEMVSRSLGMNRLRTFLIVTLPQIRPSVITGLLFAFISALDETVVALFISGGEHQTLTKRMFTALRDEIDPTIAAISTLLTAVSFLVVMLVSLNARREARSDAAP